MVPEIDVIRPSDRAEYEQTYAKIKKIQEEYEQTIKSLITKAEELNPLYSAHKCKSIKEFGETWSENYLKSILSNIAGNGDAGYDVFGKKYKRIEIKSSRLDYVKDKWTMNQLHLNEADAYIFIWYNVDKGTYKICFMTKEDVKKYLKPSHQHNDKEKKDNDCYLFKNAIYRRKIMDKFMVSSIEELNEKV